MGETNFGGTINMNFMTLGGLSSFYCYREKYLKQDGSPEGTMTEFYHQLYLDIARDVQVSHHRDLI